MRQLVMERWRHEELIFDTGFVRRAIHAMPRGKTCAKDNLVAEMLQALACNSNTLGITIDLLNTALRIEE